MLPGRAHPVVNTRIPRGNHVRDGAVRIGLDLVIVQAAGAVNVFERDEPGIREIESDVPGMQRIQRHHQRLVIGNPEGAVRRISPAAAARDGLAERVHRLRRGETGLLPTHQRLRRRMQQCRGVPRDFPIGRRFGRRWAQTLDRHLERFLPFPIREGIAHQQHARPLVRLNMVVATGRRRGIDGDDEIAVGSHLDVPVAQTADRRVEM